MTEKYKTDQEEFWAGQFGNEYAVRNRGTPITSGNIALFSKILGRCGQIHSLIEFGANIGLNLQAVHTLLPDLQLAAVEINEVAVKELVL